MLWHRISVFAAALYSCCQASPDYHEHLLVRPLPESALLASFTFQSNTSVSSFEQQDFRFFPRSLGQILQHAKTKELHLRFRSGRWDEAVWGAKPRGGSREGGTGVELWAWVEADSDEECVCNVCPDSAVLTLTQGEREMAHIDECSFWPVLRFNQLH